MNDILLRTKNLSSGELLYFYVNAAGERRVVYSLWDPAVAEYEMGEQPAGWIVRGGGAAKLLWPLSLDVVRDVGMPHGLPAFVRQILALPDALVTPDEKQALLESVCCAAFALAGYLDSAATHLKQIADEVRIFGGAATTIEKMQALDWYLKEHGKDGG